jgi:hypothetical protein
MSFSKLIRNEFFAAFISFIVLGIVGLISKTVWYFLFSIILSYVLGDVFLNFFIHGGEGFAKIFSENRFACKGHAFIVFLAGIILGTFLSALIVDWIMQYAQTQTTWDWALAITDFVVVCAVLGDLEWRFYTR